jgi:hypothetical protein
MVTMHSLSLMPTIETCAHIDNIILITCCEAQTGSHTVSEENPSVQQDKPVMETFFIPCQVLVKVIGQPAILWFTYCDFKGRT